MTKCSIERLNGLVRNKSQKSNLKNQNDILKIKNYKTEDWEKIRDIGPIVAKSIADYFQDQKNQDFLARLVDAGVKIKYASTGGQKLVGLTFVFTGGLENLSREKAKEKVREQGGEISESVSKKTSYVVAGSDPGEKYDKAQKLGIKILSENDFLELIK